MAKIRTDDTKPDQAVANNSPDIAAATAQTLGAVKMTKASSLWGDAWRRFLKNKLAIVGIIIMLLIVIPVLGAELFQRYDPTLSQYDRSPGAPKLGEQNFSPPSLKHWFGTDASNRDLWSRMLHGGRSSLLVGVVVQLIVLLIGVPLGLLAGFFGGKVDTFISFFVNIFYAFPSLLLALLLLSALGGNIFWVFISIGVGLWPSMARLVRGQVLSLREKEFVEASRAIGVKNAPIMFKHILPNCLGPIIVIVSFGIPQAIQLEAFLGFIGVSVAPPATSWGQLINDGYQAFINNTPTILLIPAAAIALTCLSLNFIGDGLRDAFDPRTKK
jgi:oligopeptide transport system permease protein